LRLASRCTVYNIEEFIVKNIKKLFMREQIINGEVTKRLKLYNYGNGVQLGFVQRGMVYWDRSCEMDKPKHLMEMHACEKSKTEGGLGSDGKSSMGGYSQDSGMSGNTEVKSSFGTSSIGKGGNKIMPQMTKLGEIRLTNDD